VKSVLSGLALVITWTVVIDNKYAFTDNDSGYLVKKYNKQMNLYSAVLKAVYL